MSFLSLPPGVAARPTLAGITAAADLRAVAPSALFVGLMQALTTFGSFSWSAASLAVDDGISVIKPNDIAPINPGRWLIGTVPPGTGSAEIIVANMAALTALPVGGFSAGQGAWVQTLDAAWRWSPVPVGVANGITIIPDSAAGQWWREPALSLRWARRAAWFVDLALGSDEADGAIATPLRTAAELYRRLAPFGVWNPALATTVSFVPNAIPYALPATRYESNGGSIEFVTKFGAAVIDQWAAVTARVPAAQTLPLAQSTAVPLVVGDLVNLQTAGARVWAPVCTQVGDAFHLRMAAAWNAATGLPAAAPEPVVADFFNSPALAKLAFLGTHDVTGPLVVSVATLEIASVVTPGRLVNWRVSACRASAGLVFEECVVGGCYLTGIVLRRSRVQCSAHREVVIDGGPTTLLAGNIAGDSAAPATDGFEIGAGGRLVVGNPIACDFNIVSPVVLASRDARVSLAAVDSFFGTAGWSISFTAPGPYVEKIAAAIGVGFIGTSGVDFTFAGFADLWFPPLPAGGGAVPAALPVPTWAALAAAPFLGVAQQILTDTRWRGM